MIPATRATTPGTAGSNGAAMGLSRSLSFGLAVAALGTALAGCTASAEDVQPIEGTIFFPTALAVSPDDAFLFVASANSDLRHDSGTVEVADLNAIASVIAAWKATAIAPTGCTAATDRSGTLACPPLGLLKENAAVRTGNFAAAMAVQDLGDGKLRLIVPVRGDPSVTWIDWDGGALSCSDAEGFELCADSHRLSRLRDDRDLPTIPDEPYGVYADSVGEFAVVTHLTSGTVTLVDSPAAGTPVLADSITGLFGAINGTVRGATGVAGRAPGPDNIIYVQSRSENRVQLVTVARPEGASPFLVPTSYFFLDSVGGVGGGGQSEDGRGITFDATGDRAFMINRSPPSLQVYDTRISADGTPRNELLAATDICREASSLVVGDGGGGERAYVSCFSEGELYVIDPRGRGTVEAVTVVGRGPFGLALAPSKHLLFISNFLDNSLAVIDLDPDSPMLNRVILRIGVRS